MWWVQWVYLRAENSIYKRDQQQQQQEWNLKDLIHTDKDHWKWYGAAAKFSKGYYPVKSKILLALSENMPKLDRSTLWHWSTCRLADFYASKKCAEKKERLSTANMVTLRNKKISITRTYINALRTVWHQQLKNLLSSHCCLYNQNHPP